MNISIIGSGYVGLVTGACLSELGNRVICVDNDTQKITNLKKNIIPIYEPGLEELIANNVKRKRLTFSSRIKDAVETAEIIFIAVGTPSLDNGEADLTGIENVAYNIAINMKSYRLIVEKSTVPVETGIWVKRTIQAYIKHKIKFDIASNPEFLREGQAINDFMHPDRIVIGAESKRAKDLLTCLYKPLNAPLVITDIRSAELIKHASNSFLATKISFINAISNVCDRVGADIIEVAAGVGLDKRIGASFLNAGIGYGGSCFPKDLDAFIQIAEKMGYSFGLLKAVKEINQEQKAVLIEKIKKVLWIIKDKTIGILGLAFKPNTDDIRFAPSIFIIENLLKDGFSIITYDQEAMINIKKLFGDKIKYASNPYHCLKNSDALIILTEWNEFKQIDLEKVKKLLKQPYVFDGRNIYNPVKMKEMGFKYFSVGRS